MLYSIFFFKLWEILLKAYELDLNISVSKLLTNQHMRQ